jgi:hypothetical protein
MEYQYTLQKLNKKKQWSRNKKLQHSTKDNEIEKISYSRKKILYKVLLNMYIHIFPKFFKRRRYATIYVYVHMEVSTYVFPYMKQ